MNSRNHAAIFVFILIVGLFAGDSSFRNCNRYTSFGYGYRDFFEYKPGNFSPNQVFYLEFFVKTVSDAHILLKRDVDGDDAYEIVIGGGSNTFSQIRMIGSDYKNNLIMQKTDNLLSGLQYRAFYIAMDHLGILSVGVKEEDEVFLNWRFDNPFPIRYFSFGSWTNIKADWRFGCNQATGSQYEIMEGENIPPLQKLKKDIFTLYDPNVVPIGKYTIVEVKVNFLIHKVSLDEKRGEITVHGSADLKWNDGKVRWKPEDYGGIDMMHIPPFQIWTPNLRVLNSISIDKMPLFDLTAAGVIVQHDGSVFWRPPYKMVSSCVVDLKYWPYDTHNCSILFGFWMEPASVVLTVMEEYDLLTEYTQKSDWEIISAVPFNDDTSGENYGLLDINLRRKHGPQTLLLTASYIAAAVMSLSSFWIGPEDSRKLYLICGSLILLLLTLFLMAEEVPAATETPPVIFNFYSLTTVISCLPLVMYILMKNMPKSIHVSEKVSKILNNTILNIIFCLPELSQSLSEYADLNEEGNKLNKDRINAVRLSTVIERLFFVLYLVLLLLPVFLY